MIRVLIAEDVRMLNDALIQLLAYEADIEVVAAVESGVDVVPAARRTRPDVAVIDIELPELDGLSAAAEIHQQLPACKILILTGIGRPGHLRRSMEVHAAGFMLKSSRPPELIAAIRTVFGGGRVIDPHLAYAALDVRGNPLTEREIDVLRLTATGSSPREVAAELHLTYGTVRNYLASAVTKLNARNRVDAIRLAGDAGWL